ncbi:MAG TPA: type II toxin-antitoxin system Phd/YefM family antitoxin [Gaiella sp.]|jgi:prevent-host-death family protein|nr:type II toxin-antitoxin system Phd/YefM family antitoxin [Gaiella sp.]
MAVVNMHEAKTQLSKLVERAAQGEDVVIAKAGRPVARLVPYEEDRLPRKPGAWAGQVWIADDFDELPADLLAAFNGEAE